MEGTADETACNVLGPKVVLHLRLGSKVADSQ